MLSADTTDAEALLSWVLADPPGDWVERAACVGLPCSWFVSSGAVCATDLRAALATCPGCGVLAECRRYAMALPGLPGVWGGMTEAMRRRERAREWA